MDDRIPRLQGRRLAAQRGLTLVEIMVSSIILGISISATATILRVGQDLEYKRNVERQAFRLAYSALEDPNYHYYPNYNALAYSTSTVVLNTGGRHVNATVTVTPYAESKELWPPYNTTFWRRVDAKVTWNLEGTPDSVIATKILGEAR